MVQLILEDGVEANCLAGEALEIDVLRDDTIIIMNNNSGTETRTQILNDLEIHEIMQNFKGKDWH